MLPQTRYLTRLSLWMVLLLPACAGSATPQLIGSYPREVVATYAPPRNSVVVYDTYLKLLVADVGVAAEESETLAYSHGGYVSSSQSWYTDGQLHSTLALAVPVAAFDGLYGALLRLGTLEGERLTGSLQPGGDGTAWNVYATITVHLAPEARAWRWPTLPAIGWSPLSTFRAAFTVFAGIFTYMVDIVIWVTVVLGPFALMGLGLRAVIRRWKRRL